MLDYLLDKYPEHTRKMPVRVDEKKYVHLDRFDAPEFIWKHINGKVVHGNTLNLDWCDNVYNDMLLYSSKDPTLTLVFEQHGLLYIDTTDAFDYKTMKLRDWLAYRYEIDHQTFTRKCRNLTGIKKEPKTVVKQTNSPEYNHWYYITKTKEKRKQRAEQKDN